MEEKFKCLGDCCKNHCCKSYSGMSSKMRSLSGISFEKIILLPKDITKIKECGRSDLINEPMPNGITTIKTAEDGTCAALINGRCSIYDCRPSICRAYPLYLDMFTGICTLKECKPSDRIQEISDVRENVQSLVDIYEYWLNYYSKE